MEKPAVWYVGIDPGLTGAIAFYDLANDKLGPVWDMPTLTVKVGTTKRDQLDAHMLLAYLRELNRFSVKKVALERVQGYGKQGAVSSFNFGMSAGMTYMGVVSTEIPLDHVRPQIWKRAVQCGTDEASILRRARELFPGRDDWFGPKGGFKDGRAEAAMLAYYCAKISVRT